MMNSSMATSMLTQKAWFTKKKEFRKLFHSDIEPKTNYKPQKLFNIQQFKEFILGEYEQLGDVLRKTEE